MMTLLGTFVINISGGDTLGPGYGFALQEDAQRSDLVAIGGPDPR